MMNKEDLKNKLSFVIDDEKPKALYLYFVPKQGVPLKLEYNAEMEGDMLSQFCYAIKQTFWDAEYRIVDFSKADERKNFYFKYDMNEKASVMDNMQKVLTSVEEFEHFSTAQHHIADMESVLVKISSGEEKVVLFNPFYNVQKFLTNQRIIFGFKDDDRFDRVKGDMFSIVYDFRMIQVDNDIIINKTDNVEKILQLDNVIDNEAKKQIKVVKSLNIVKDANKVEQLLKGDVTLSRKLIKATEDSPIVKNRVGKDAIFSVCDNNDKLKRRYKFDNNHKIIVEKKSQLRNFIALLNDEYLKSLFSGEEYQSGNKDVLK